MLSNDKAAGPSKKIYRLMMITHPHDGLPTGGAFRRESVFVARLTHGQTVPLKEAGAADCLVACLTREVIEVPGFAEGVDDLRVKRH